MAIARRLQRYISEHELAWEPVAHEPSTCCMDSAHRAHVPADRLAKAILLEDDYGYVVAVIAADSRLDLQAAGQALDRALTLASEREAAALFPDCEPGAIPPVGEAYGIATVWDASLADKPDVYFEGGDHRTLVRMSGREFSALMNGGDRMPLALH